jgi:hypothetical protein
VSCANKPFFLRVPTRGGPVARLFVDVASKSSLLVGFPDSRPSSSSSSVYFTIWVLRRFELLVEYAIVANRKDDEPKIGGKEEAIRSRNFHGTMDQTNLNFIKLIWIIDRKVRHAKQTNILERFI